MNSIIKNKLFARVQDVEMVCLTWDKAVWCVQKFVITVYGM